MVCCVVLVEGVMCKNDLYKGGFMKECNVFLLGVG